MIYAQIARIQALNKCNICDSEDITHEQTAIVYYDKDYNEIDIDYTDDYRHYCNNCAEYIDNIDSIEYKEMIRTFDDKTKEDNK